MLKRYVKKMLKKCAS